MKLVYWGGGIREDRIAGFKQFLDLMKLEPSYHKIPDLRNPAVLVLSDLLVDMEDKELYGEDHASNFMQIASPSVKSAHDRADTQTRRKESATTVFSKDMANGFLPRYKKLAEELSTRSHDLYASAKRRLDKLDVLYLVVPGPHDTAQILDVFEDKVLHMNTQSLDGKVLLGIGAIDGHESSLPNRARLGSTTPEDRFAAEQEFLASDKGAQRSDILITPYFMGEYFSKDVIGNKHYVPTNFGHIMQTFATGHDAPWFTNREKRQRKLIVTSASHAGRDTEACPMPGGVVLNAGKNVTLGSHGAYCITLGPDGVEKIGAVYLRGNAHTVYRPSGDTFASDMPTGHTTYVFNVKDVAKYPGAGATTVVELVAPGGKYDGTVKRGKTQKIRCAEETESLQQKITRVRQAKKAVELELDESHRDFRSLNREYKELCNAYASLAYKFVERNQYRMGVEAYQESLDFAPERMTEMRAAILHNIGTVFENRNKPLDAVAWYALANDQMPQHRVVKESYARAVNKFMKK